MGCLGMVGTVPLSGGVHAQTVSAYALPPVAAEGRCRQARGRVCPRAVGRGQLQATAGRPASLGELQPAHPQLSWLLLLPVQGGFHKVQVYLYLLCVDQSKRTTAQGTGSSQRQEEEMWEAKRKVLCCLCTSCVSETGMVFQVLSCLCINYPRDFTVKQN